MMLGCMNCVYYIFWEFSLYSDTVNLQRGKLTKEGFLRLNQMEADDNQGDTDDLWVTLSSMGFNKELKLDEVGFSYINYVG